MNIEIIQIWISTGHDFKGRHGQERLSHGLESKDCVELVAGRGIQGDRYFDHKPDFKGQITFFAEHVAARLEQDLNVPSVDRSAFRRNVLIAGTDLNALIGKHFTIGDIVFSGSEECAPCYWMDQAITPGAHEWLKGNGGLRCRILTSGQLTTGSHKLTISDEAS